MIGPSARCQNTAFDNFEMLESLETGNHWHIIGKLGNLDGLTARAVRAIPWMRCWRAP